MKARTNDFLVRRLVNGVGAAILGAAGGLLLRGMVMPFVFIRPELADTELLPALVLGGLVGFAFGYRTWPDRSSRNAQDPPGLCSEPAPDRPRARSSPPARRMAIGLGLFLAPVALAGALILGVELAVRSAEGRYEPRNFTPLHTDPADLVGTYWDLERELSVALIMSADETFTLRRTDSGLHLPESERSGTWLFADDRVTLRFDDGTVARFAPVAYEGGLALLDEDEGASPRLLRKVED